MNNENDKKRIQNLFTALQNDSKSVFYANPIITKKLLKKLEKSPYLFGRVFNEIYQKLDDKDFNKTVDRIPLKHLFLRKRVTLIDQLFTALGNRLKKFMLTLQI